MTDEERKNFKEKYERLKKTKGELIKLQKKIEEYEQNPIVREYLSLKENLDSCKDYSFFEVIDMDESAILEKAFKETKIKGTNNIYVYISSHKGKNELNEENIKSEIPLRDVIVPYKSKLEEYRKYRNIELSKKDENYEVRIPIDECEKFERDNLVLHSKVQNGTDYYKKIRNLYFYTIYESGEKRALEKIMYKRNLQKDIIR